MALTSADSYGNNAVSPHFSIAIKFLLETHGSGLLQLIFSECIDIGGKQP